MTEFDEWLARRFREAGSFTILVVLVRIEGLGVDLLRSTHLHVVGDEVTWAELSGMFGSAGVAWNGAAFFEAVPDAGLPTSDLPHPEVAAQRPSKDAPRSRVLRGPPSGRAPQQEERPATDALVPDAAAKRQLALLVERLNEDRLVLNEGNFFDRAGRRLAIEEATAH